MVRPQGPDRPLDVGECEHNSREVRKVWRGCQGVARNCRTDVTFPRSKTMDFNKSDTALVVIDPQNDVLSEKGVSWGLVGASVKENNTVENLARLFKAAKD